MKCIKCTKEITIADCPNYTTLEQIKKEWDDTVYLLCAICRVQVEKQHKDLVYEDVIKQMDNLVGQGYDVFVKFTCHNCGARQTLDEPNKFFTVGVSCEECKKTSYPNKFGFTLIARIT